MSHGTLDYQFTESLYVTGNIEAGEMNGTASIDYDREGNWSVDGVYLDGWDKIARKFNTTVKLPETSEVYRILHDRLTTGKTAQFISSEVLEKLEGDGVRFRSDRQEHSTLHSAAHGV